MKFFLIFLFALNALHFSKANIFKASKIIGGSNAERREFPYMVALHDEGRHTCGASILSISWVITAAHCCDEHLNQNCSTKTVIAGQLEQNENHPDVQRSNVATVIIHPEYHYTGFEIDNDIALLRLSTSLIFTEAVKPVALPASNQLFTEGWLSGWGIFERSPPMFPVTLQYLKMNIITNDECKEVLKNFSPNEQLLLLESMFCAMPPSGGSETGCNGDSGGPIAKDGVLVGLASWAVSCSIYKENAPTVFTAVNKYLEFINEHVKDLAL